MVPANPGGIADTAGEAPAVAGGGEGGGIRDRARTRAHRRRWSLEIPNPLFRKFGPTSLRKYRRRRSPMPRRPLSFPIPGAPILMAPSFAVRSRGVRSPVAVILGDRVRVSPGRVIPEGRVRGSLGREALEI